MIRILTCKVGDKIINCYDGTYNKDQLKKWADKNILLCPVCDKPYEYCHGEVMSPYFRHKDKEMCKNRYSEPETEEHINGKIQLYEWIRVQEGVSDVILEGWIPETKQRPDIMFKYNDKQYVIEYQCTPIATEYYERHNLYKVAGINDIWICGAEKYFQYYHEKSGKTGNKKVSEIEKINHIYYDSKTKLFYIIDVNMSEKYFKSITYKKKKIIYLMETPLDYKQNIENFYIIKDKLNSYDSYSYYPSGRPSRKYPYPCKKYEFNINMSLAKCISINDFIFEIIPFIN